MLMKKRGWGFSLLGVGAGQAGNRITEGGQQDRGASYGRLSLESHMPVSGQSAPPGYAFLNTSKRPFGFHFKKSCCEGCG